MPKQSKIERTAEFERALALMEGDQRFVFITGRAGTGKSTLLKLFRAQTKLTCVYLAPTGVAALNVNGETIHSFFRFHPGITAREAAVRGKRADKELYKSVDVMVIDEISMVRADLMDCADAFLRSVTGVREPFGGKRVIAIGDLYQLPPVVRRDEGEEFAERYPSPYFFSSDAVDLLRASGEICLVELDRVFRQKDATFIGLLNGVRNRTIENAQLDELNKRVEPVEMKDAPIYLTTTNAAANEINAGRLADLRGKIKAYPGYAIGKFSEKDFPTEAKLPLKAGARVMFLNNDIQDRWVNGTLGTILSLGKNSVEVQIDDGEIETVEPFMWNLYQSAFDRESGNLEQEKIGSYTQIPLRLAWATTIHKSQGKTFDRCVIDLGNGAFAPGQVYVALSRCRTLEGIRLIQPVGMRDLRLDWRVQEFLTTLQYGAAEGIQSIDEKRSMLEDAIESALNVRITYLKSNDAKSVRAITPYAIEDDEYNGHAFTALRAHGAERREDVVFNLARVLKVEKI